MIRCRFVQGRLWERQWPLRIRYSTATEPYPVTLYVDVLAQSILPMQPMHRPTFAIHSGMNTNHERPHLKGMIVLSSKCGVNLCGQLVASSHAEEVRNVLDRAAPLADSDRCL